jgi:chromosome segregation ATPase
MHLPAMLDSLEKPRGLPETTLKYSLQLDAEGGIHRLQDGLENLLSYEKVLNNKLSTNIRLLDEEQEEDSRARSLYANRYQRASSQQLSAALREETENHRNLLQTAIASNRLVRERLETASSSIQRLAGTQKDLENMIPSDPIAEKTPPTMRPDIASTMKDLRHLLNNWETLQQDRTKLVLNLRQIQEQDRVGRYIILFPPLAYSRDT